MKDIDKEDALRIVSELAENSDEVEDSKRQLSHDKWNEAAYLEKNDLVKTEFLDEGFLIELKDAFALGRAKGALTKANLFYNGRIENLSPEMIEIEKDEEEPIENYSLENAPEYHILIYAFGHALNEGRDRKIQEDALGNLMEEDISEKLGILESTGYLDSFYEDETKYFRLVKDKDVREWSMEIANRIDEEYGYDIARYQKEIDEAGL